MNNEKMGKFIEQLRKEKGISQKSLAQMIPVGREAVSKWERGENAPSSTSLYKLRDIFEVSIDELMYGEHITPENEEEISKVSGKIYDENNAKNSKIKILIAVIVILLIVLFCTFLFIYFINTFDTLKVYTLNCHNDEIAIEDGLFLATREKTYFKMGEIKALSDKEIEYTKLFYSTPDGKKKTILEQDDPIINLYDFNNYGVNFDYDNIVNFLTNTSLKVTFEDQSSTTLKLEFVRDFTNDYIFPKRLKNYTNDSKNEEINSNFDIDIEDRIKREFTFESEGIYKMKKDGYTYIYHANTRLLSLVYKKEKTQIIWEKFMYNNVNKINYIETYDEEKINDYFYYFDTDTYECNIFNCQYDNSAIKIFIEKTLFIYA